MWIWMFDLSINVSLSLVFKKKLLLLLLLSLNINIICKRNILIATNIDICSLVLLFVLLSSNRTYSLDFLKLRFVRPRRLLCSLFSFFFFFRILFTTRDFWEGEE